MIYYVILRLVDIMIYEENRCMNTFINIFLSPTLCALIYTVRLTKKVFSISPIRIDTLDSLLSMSILSSAEKCIFQNNLVNRKERIIYKLNIETLIHREELVETYSIAHYYHLTRVSHVGKLQQCFH